MNWLIGIFVVLIVLVFIIPFYTFVLSKAWTLGKMTTQFKFIKGVSDEKEKDEHRG